MPTLDLWFDAEAGMFHYVAPFLSKFSWKGGAVGVRLRLEPAASVGELRQLAWAYHTARLPVKDMGADSLAWPIDLLDFWLREGQGNDWMPFWVKRLQVSPLPMHSGRPVLRSNRL